MDYLKMLFPPSPPNDFVFKSENSGSIHMNIITNPYLYKIILK